MSRNPHPEETIRKILDVSLRLFLEKGYDNTTIQDIVDELGMSKGAIYHHFKSKEEIFDQIGDSYYQDIDWFRDIREDKTESGLEKLREIFLLELTSRKKIEINRIGLPLIKNPRILLLSLQCAIETTAPMIQELLEEGVQDGSIQVEQPREMSEALLVLLNMWIALFSSDADSFNQKIRFLKSFTDGMGLPVIDDCLLSVCARFYQEVLSNAPSSPPAPNA